MTLDKFYIIIIAEKIQKKSKKETQNMKRAKTFAGVKRDATLINNNQAKKLALLIIFKTGTKHRDV